SGPDHTLIGGEIQSERNIIAGNTEAGIEITGISTNYTRVLGNYIGVNKSGTADLANQMGILIGSSAKYTQIGGDLTAARNVISGNNEEGVYIESASEATVQGNFIGTDHNGSAAIPNLGSGILIASSTNNTIGGSLEGDECSGTCNLVSGNLGAGIGVYSSKANIVQGNYVGSDRTGEAGLGNQQGGVRLDLPGTEGNLIGGETGGVGNLIRFNQAGGVILTSSTSTNELTGNRIENNRGIAIRYTPGNILGVNNCSGNEFNLVETRMSPKSPQGRVHGVSGRPLAGPPGGGPWHPTALCRSSGRPTLGTRINEPRAQKKRPGSRFLRNMLRLSGR
ncbi:MAG: right-handed parallel beta-helix repeat-containing protein, partial [Haliea sp.]